MKPVTLTRWSITVRDWIGSETLRGMSAEAECLFVRLCLDQWEHGAARSDKAFWKRSHGHRMHDFERAWLEASEPFQRRDTGLVHPRVEADRLVAIGEITAKAHGAKDAAATRVRSEQGRFVPRTAPGVLEVSSSSPPGAIQVSPSSASASASASGSGISHPSFPTETPNALPASAPPPAGTASTEKTKKPRKEPTGAHAEVIRAFESEFFKRRGVKYAFEGGKDGKAVQTLLARADGNPAAVIARIPALFEDDFYGPQASLTMLVSAWNKLAAKVAVPQAPRDILPPGSEPTLDFMRRTKRGPWAELKGMPTPEVPQNGLLRSHAGNGKLCSNLDPFDVL